jgi:hypothetical protein
LVNPPADQAEVAKLCKEIRVRAEADGRDVGRVGGVAGVISLSSGYEIML